MQRIRYGPFLLLVVAAAVGCSSPASSAAATPATTPSVASSPAPTPALTATDVAAVANKIWFGPNGAPCATATMSQCPVTARLAARLQAIERPAQVGPGPIPYWCRCSHGSTMAVTGEVTPTGGVAHLTFDSASKVDYIMVRQAGSLVVDDTRCAGGDVSTSIYAAKLAFCG
jgi:hypothetical protein